MCGNLTMKNTDDDEYDDGNDQHGGDGDGLDVDTDDDDDDDHLS